MPNLQVELPKDCTECGACCAYKPNWIEVSELDRQRINDDTLINIGDSQHHMKMKWTGINKCRCVALDGRIGGAIVCTIYDKRPEICRLVERGSPICLFSLGYHDIAPQHW